MEAAAVEAAAVEEGEAETVEVVEASAKRSGGPWASSRGAGAVANVPGGPKLGAPASPPASGAKSAV